jgi:nitrous oxidase accessory protein NosD
MARNETHEQRQNRRRKQALALAAATIGATGTVVAVHVGNRFKDREKKRPPVVAPSQGVEALYRAQSGQTLTLSPGTYKLRPVTWKGLQRLTVQGNGAVLDGTGIRDVGGFYLKSCQDIRFENLTIRNCNGSSKTNGIYAEQCERLTFRRVKFLDNGRSGFLCSQVDDLTIEDCVASGNKAEHGLYASDDSDRVIFRRNTCERNGKTGLQINAVDTGGDRLSEACLVEGNTCRGNGSKGMNLAGVVRSLVKGNVVEGNRDGAVAIYDGSRDIRFEGNRLTGLVGIKKGSTGVVIIGAAEVKAEESYTHNGKAVKR